MPTARQPTNHRHEWERSVDLQLAEQNSDINSMKGTLSEVKTGINSITDKLDSLEIKAGSYGSVSARTVVTICISIAALFVAAVGTSVTIISIVGALAVNPITDRLNEEVADQERVDAVNAVQGEKIAALEKGMAGLKEENEAVNYRLTETKEWMLEKSDDTRLLLEAMNIEYLISKQGSRDEALLQLLKEIADGKEEGR